MGRYRSTGGPRLKRRRGSGVLLKEIRGRLDGVLRDKIEMPDEDVTASGGPVVEAILQLLNTEPATAAPTNANSVYS